MIHLKSKALDVDGAFPAEFAVLIEPDVPLHSDDELYAAVRQNGKAKITMVNADLSFGKTVELDAVQFCAEWRGD